MILLTIISIVGLSVIIGISVFLFRRRQRDDFRNESNKKEVLTLTLRGLQDIDMISEMVNRGNVVILGVKDLAKLDMIRLKRSIQQLKSNVQTNGGDIVALGKEFVVVVPPNMKLSFIRKLIDEADEKDDVNPPIPPTEVGTL